MTLEDLTTPNLATALGLGLLAVAVPTLLPSLRPGVVSAIRVGLDLFAESEGEAETELIQALVEGTLGGLRQELANPAPEAARREAVRHHVSHFKRRAATRARRWTGDEAKRAHVYRRHVAALHSALEGRRRHAAPEAAGMIDEAVAALAAQ